MSNLNITQSQVAVSDSRHEAAGQLIARVDTG
jgi:hypothetical protein